MINRASAVVDNYYSYRGTCGVDITWELDDKTGVLKIEGVGKIGDYSAVNMEVPWRECRDLITKIEISDGITCVGAFAFRDLTNLVSVKMPDSVVEICKYAFAGCYSLSNLELSQNLIYIHQYAFEECESITRIFIPNSVKTIEESAFEECRNLDYIHIGSGVTEISDDCFLFCDKLATINVSALNEHFSSDEYGVLFDKNQSTLLKYPNGNIRTTYEIPNNVKNIGNYAFYASYKLTEISLPDSVMQIGDKSFYACINLTSINLPTKLEHIGVNAFGNCGNLGNISIPNSVEYIGDKAFENCKSFTEITIPYSVKCLGPGVFDSCFSLKSIIVDKENNNYSNDELGVLFNKNKTELIQYPLGNELKKYVIPEKVVVVCEGAFSNAYNLTEIVIVSGITTISRRAFSGCSALATVSLPDTVAQIGAMAFYSCEIADVYYSGDAESWNEITIEPSNDSLVEASIHYNNVVRNFAVKDDTNNEYIVSCHSDYFQENHNDTFVASIEERNSDTNFIESGTDAEGYHTLFLRFDLHIENDGIKVNVDGKGYCFTIQIPIPRGEEYDKYNNFVLKHRLPSGKTENLKYTILIDEITGQRYLRFNTTSFSYFDLCLSFEFGFSQEVLELNCKQTTMISATNEPSLKVLYSSSAPEIVSIDEKGSIIANGKGSAIITAILENWDGTKFEDTCTVSVVNSFEIPENILELENLELIYKNTASIPATADEGVKVTYTSSNPDVATVDGNGNITTHSRGTATITATIVDDFGEEYTDTCEVTVKFTFWQWIIYILFLGFLWY